MVWTEKIIAIRLFWIAIEKSLSTKSFRGISKAPILPVADNVPHTAPPSDQQSVAFSFDFSDESDLDNHLAAKTV
uniref:Uncharacterized protein n=1 Tax=Setaria digitata TaxID=48799 RepID=A0A915Q5Z1_9BILA